MFCFVSISNASIYIDGQFESEDILDIIDSSYNKSSFIVDKESIINIHSNSDNFVNLSLIDIKDNSILNLYSDIPIFMMFNVMDVYEIKENFNFNRFSYSFDGDNIKFLRKYDDGYQWISSVNLADNAKVNVFIPEPISILILGVGGIFIFPRVKKYKYNRM